MNGGSLKDVSRSWSLEPVDGAVFGKRVFVDIIKLRSSRGDYPGLSRQALNPKANVLKTGKQRRFETETRGPREDRGRGRD